MCSKEINNKGCIISCGYFNHQESIKRKQLTNKTNDLAELITSNPLSLGMELPNSIGIHCPIELAKVYDSTGHIRSVIVEYTTHHNYSIGCKLTSLNHDKLKEKPLIN